MPIGRDQYNDCLFDRGSDQAIATLELSGLLPGAHVGEVFRLSSQHRYHADALMLLGVTDRVRRELEDVLYLLRSVPAADTDVT
jgi:hypothetical protein